MLPEFHGLAFRHWLLRDATGRHALTWAAGGLRADGDDYGAVWFAFGELAYALRPKSWFALVAGGGKAVHLNDSRTPPWGCEGVCLAGPPAKFEAGHAAPWLRLEAGWSF